MGRMPVCAYQTRLCRRHSMRERPRMQGEESTQHALHGNKATHHRPFWQSECMKHARPFGSTAVLALTLRIDRREAPANTPTCLDDRNWHVTAAPRVAAPRETGGVALSRTPSCAWRANPPCRVHACGKRTAHATDSRDLRRSVWRGVRVAQRSFFFDSFC